MPLGIRPFPLPLRIGTDICSISRIARLIQKNGQLDKARLCKFLKRTSTTHEIDLFTKLIESWAQNSEFAGRVSTHLAGRFVFVPTERDLRVEDERLKGVHRWAAKEAVIKAASRPITLRDVVVFQHPKTNVPYGIVVDHSRIAAEMVVPRAEQDVLRGEFPSTIAHAIAHGQLRGQLVQLSISHDADYAVATALAAAEPEPGIVVDGFAIGP